MLAICHLGAQLSKNLRGTLLAICHFGSSVFQKLKGDLNSSPPLPKAVPRKNKKKRREEKRREEKRREEKRREEKRREEKRRRREGKRREEKRREGKRRERERASAEKREEIVVRWICVLTQTFQEEKEERRGWMKVVRLNSGASQNLLFLPSFFLPPKDQKGMGGELRQLKCSLSFSLIRKKKNSFVHSLVFSSCCLFLLAE